MRAPWMAVLILSLLLTGCAATKQDIEEQADYASFTAKEKVIKETRDQNKLISFYKEYLKQGEDERVRIKLVDAYLAADDLDSASFHYDSLSNNTHFSPNGLYLKAQIEFAKGNADKAIEAGLEAIEAQSPFPEVENLLGMAYASQHDIDNAWHYFYLARKHFFDDITIKNNLAVIDLMLQDYTLAISRLEPIYLSGNHDDTIAANLALAYAKSGQFEAFKSIYTGRFTTQEIEDLYIGLRLVTATSSEKLFAKQQTKKLNKAIAP